MSKRSRLSVALVVVVGILPFVTVQAGADNDLAEDMAVMLTDVGCIVPLVTAGALTFMGDERKEKTGRQTLNALLASTLVTQGLKKMIGAPRPSNPNARSGFPSGHASISFAFARAVAAEHAQWELPAYLWATAVSWSRLQRNEHTFGQVAAGAAVGWYVADRSIANKGGLFGWLFVKEGVPDRLNSTALPQAPGITLWAHQW